VAIRNPAGTSLLLIGLAGLLGYLAIRKRKAPEQILPPEPPGPEPPPPPPPGPPGPSQGHYVGDPSGPFDWPHKDMFSTPLSFQTWLQTHGYPNSMSGNVRDDPTIQAVGTFQNDFNDVRIHLQQKGWSVPPKLTVDGRLGVNTINAMWNVDTKILPNTYGGAGGATWQDVVEAVQSGQAETIV